MVAAKPDCTGLRFGKLVVLGKGEIQRIPRTKNGKSVLASRQLWRCRCDCGHVGQYPRGDFDKPAGRKSCGCLGRNRKGDTRYGRKTGDLLGQRFGSLVVVERLGSRVRNGECRPYWLCQCDCGGVAERSSNTLRLGYARGRFCDDRLKHPALREQYPPTPTPYPAEAAELVEKYLKYTQCRLHLTPLNQAIEDEKVDLLLRSAWIVTYRRSRGEQINEIHERRYLLKCLGYAKLVAYWRSKIERNGGIAYTMNGRKVRVRRKGIGSEMTDQTFLFEDVKAYKAETRPENTLPKSARRLRFKRC